MAELTCAKCGAKKKNMHVHHKDKNRENNTIENLILLCSNCHGTYHAGHWTYEEYNLTLAHMSEEQFELMRKYRTTIIKLSPDVAEALEKFMIDLKEEAMLALGASVSETSYVNGLIKADLKKWGHYPSRQIPTKKSQEPRQDDNEMMALPFPSYAYMPESTLMGPASEPLPRSRQQEE